MDARCKLHTGLFLLCFLFTGCARTRFALAPNTTKAQVVVAEQKAEVVKTAGILADEIKTLERMEGHDAELASLSRYIQYKSSILLKDYRK